MEEDKHHFRMRRHLARALHPAVPELTAQLSIRVCNSAFVLEEPHCLGLEEPIEAESVPCPSHGHEGQAACPFAVLLLPWAGGPPPAPVGLSRLARGRGMLATPRNHLRHAAQSESGLPEGIRLNFNTGLQLHHQCSGPPREISTDTPSRGTTSCGRCACHVPVIISKGSDCSISFIHSTALPTRNSLEDPQGASWRGLNLAGTCCTWEAQVSESDSESDDTRQGTLPRIGS